MRRAVGGVLGRAAHGELVHVRLAEHDDAGVLDAARDGGVVRRAPSLEDLRPRRGGRPSVTTTSFIASGTRPADRAGRRTRDVRRPPWPRPCALDVDVQEGVDGRVDRRDALEVRLRDLDRGHLSPGHETGEFRRRLVGQFGRAHASSARMRGTRNLSSSTAGAPARTGVARQRRAHLVGAVDVRHRHRVRRGRDVVGRDLGDAGDRTQDHVQLPGEHVELVVADGEAGQAGEVGDVGAADARPGIAGR